MPQILYAGPRCDPLGVFAMATVLLCNAEGSLPLHNYCCLKLQSCTSRCFVVVLFFFSHAHRWCQNYNFIFSRQTSMCTKWPSACAITARTRVVHTERQLNDGCLPCAPITSVASRSQRVKVNFPPNSATTWFDFACACQRSQVCVSSLTLIVFALVTACCLWWCCCCCFCGCILVRHTNRRSYTPYLSMSMPPWLM